MARNNKMPQCIRCSPANNWVKIAVLDAATGLCLWQCGGAPAGAECEEILAGCDRIIAATEERMTQGGMI